MYVMMKVVAALLFVVGATNAFVSPSAFAGRSMAAGRVRARAGVSGAAAVGAVCSRPSMSVVDVGSPGELDKIVLTDSKDKLVVVDYSTTWCGPCKLILPKYEALSEEYKDAVFIKVIGDSTNEASQLMKREGVRSVPSFHFWKGGKKVDSVNGANEPALEDTLRSLA